VAQAAVLDPNLYLFVAEGTEVDLLADEFLFGGGGDPGVNHSHGISPKGKEEALDLDKLRRRRQSCIRAHRMVFIRHKPSQTCIYMY
jgi:hypothetical protein